MLITRQATRTYYRKRSRFLEGSFYNQGTLATLANQGLREIVMQHLLITKRYALTLIFTCTAVSGCSFHGALANLESEDLNKRWSQAAIDTAYDSNRYAVNSDSRFETHHGASCASASKAISTSNAGETAYIYGIGLEDSITFPPGFDDGTVFLNGWRLRYREGDHQVLALSTAIVDIEKQDGELSWKAGGILSDRNGDDAFDWCYNYTVLFWKSDRLDTRLGLATLADIDDSDEGADLTFLSHDQSNPLSSYRSTAYGAPALVSVSVSSEAAVLPRGFGMMWEGDSSSVPRWGEDHPLLQFSMKYGDSRLITRDDGLSYLRWNHESVFRDKNTDDDYLAAQVVSILHGTGVDFSQPDFEIYDNPPLNQPTGTRDIFSDTVIVEDVPHDVAVPVLTGWEMHDNQKEINIKDIGAWIESFDYERAPGADSGTLIYTIKSVFLDKGGRFSSVGAATPRYQVSVLGLDAIGIPRPVGEFEVTSGASLTEPQSIDHKRTLTGSDPVGTSGFDVKSDNPFATVGDSLRP